MQLEYQVFRTETKLKKVSFFFFLKLFLKYKQKVKSLEQHLYSSSKPTGLPRSTTYTKQSTSTKERSKSKDNTESSQAVMTAHQITFN